MKRISVVYMVKDPPIDRLALQVEYMREVADEFIFAVDDRTDAQTVLKMKKWPGTTIVPFKWTDDFAAGRNNALPYVTRPWTLHLDPDELPSYKMMSFLKEATSVGRDDPKGWMFWTLNWFDGDKGEEMPYHWHVRLWQSGHGKWYRRIHELVEIDGSPEEVTRFNGVVLQAPSNAYLIHSKPGAAIEADDALYNKISEEIGLV